MTEPDLKLLNSLVECLNAAETQETVVIYMNMIKKLMEIY